MAALVGWPLPGRNAVAGASAQTTGARTIGHSVRGRAIKAVERLGPGVVSRTVVVIGQVHGDETAGLRVVSALTRAQLPAGLRLLLVPTGNPDGYAARRRTNAHGVDLNRNFPTARNLPTAWQRSDRGSTYSGPQAGSEPETRALRRFLVAAKPAAVVVLHQPLHGVDTSVPGTLPLARRLAAETGLPLRSFRCAGTCHGTLTGWFAAYGSGPAVTVELGSRASAGTIARVAAGVLAALAAPSG